jgi:N12 class adenine-specific DNA methylase/adenine-specific DNA methylase
LDEVDSILRDGGNAGDSYLRIAARFAKGKTPEELTAYLQREYLRGKYDHAERESGKGFDFGNHRVSAWFDKDGISLAVGTTAKNNIHRVTISWEQAVSRVQELMLAGEYVDRPTFEDALDNERLELAGKLWNFYRDDMHFLPDEWDAEHGGYPEDEALIKSLLDDPDERQAILDRVETDVNQFSIDGNRSRWHNPGLLLSDMREAMREPVMFPNAEYSYKRNFSGFITQDEIDAYLIGHSDETKYRTLSNYLTGNGDKDFTDFLKNSYGLGGGGTHALGGADNSYGDYWPGKGITLSRGRIGDPFTKMNLNWNQAAKRVKTLIESGRFMTRAELDGIQSYERLMLVRNINNFFGDLPPEYERPFSGKTGFNSNEYRDENGESTLNFFYPHEAEWQAINDLLDNPENVNALLARMEPIYDNTVPEDRYYNTRKTAFERLSAYRDGTYTLFPNLENLPDPDAKITTRFNGSVRETVIDLSDSPSFERLRFDVPVTPAVQMSLFDIAEDSPLPILLSVEEQRTKINDTLKQEAIDADAPFLAVSDADKSRIAAQFTENPRSREAANLVREVYGDTLNMPLPQTIKRISELVAEGKFATPELSEAQKRRQDILAEITAIKNENNGAMVAYQVGDFYELYGEDAKNAAELLDISLITMRDMPEQTEMVGFPQSSLADYTKTLNEAGHTLAVVRKHEDGRKTTSIYPAIETEQAPTADRRAYAVGDTVWLGDREFRIESIGDYYKQPMDDLDRRFLNYGRDISLVDVESLRNRYPISRSMYQANFENELSLDERNAAFLPLGELSEQTAPEVADEPEPVSEPEPIPPPDFDAIAQTVYDRVMADDNFAYHLQFAQSRGALRSPLNTALDAVIGELKGESDAYRDYFNDDITDDLFDRVYRTAWENRPQPEQAQTEQEAVTSQQFTEITDSAEIAEVEAVFGETLPNEPIAVIDNVSRNNFNLFALAFPRLIDGTYQSMMFRNGNNHEMSVHYDTTNADIVNLDVSYHRPNGHKAFVPMIQFHINHDNRMLTVNGYADEDRQEDFGFLRLADDEQKEELNVRAYGYLSEIGNLGFDLRNPYATEVFRDADGNELPAEPKTNLTEFLKERAERESTAWGRVQSSMWNGESEPSQSEQTQSTPEATTTVDATLSPEAAVSQAYNDFEAVKSGAMALGKLTLESYNDKYRATGLDALVLGDLFSANDYENAAHGLPYTTGDECMPRFEVSDMLLTRELAQTAGYVIELDGRELPLPHQPQARNFRITDDHLGEGGAKAKFRNNILALQTLKTLETENRNATPGEQETLSRYVGWGGLPQAFDPENKDWAQDYAQLNELLTPEEFESARASTLNAHYTSPTVIKAMWDTIGRMGFVKGNVLEPSMGVGNFYGLLPQSMAQSKLYGVELDSVTARIAQRLYPNANIQHTGFEKTEFSDAFFDLAVGNVPFGAYGVLDKRYEKHDFSIHNYFFAKALDKVRPGGVVAFVTSKFTMDEKNPHVRKYLAERAELLGAVRLPNNAFLKNAGTETTMDILFLQKRDRPLDIEPEWVHLGLTEDGIPVNRYFLDNPEMICGKMGLDEHMNNKYGRNDYTACLPIEGADLAQQLSDALANIEGEYSVTELDDLDGVDNHAIPADPTVKNFSYAVVDDVVYFRENSLMYPVDLPAATLDRIKGMIGLRACVAELIDLQLEDYASDDAITAQQKRLNDLYDSFVAEFGLINSTANNRAFNADSAYYLLSSLEILNEDGELERKADMFTKRTIRQKTVITHVDTASEALAVSLGERARVDLDYMSELTGKSRETLLDELRGVVFLNIGSADSQERAYVTADEYLSGNVREKLKFAEAAALTAPELKVNADALKAIQPKDLEAGEISVRLGATWIDPKYVQEFMYDLLNTSYYNKSVYQVQYHRITGEWQVSGKGKSQFSDVASTVTYGTGRMNAYQILEDTLNLRDVRVYDRKTDADGKEHRVLNKKETMLAQQKQEMIKQSFKDWIWRDPERRQTLVQEYNEKFNSVRPREYDGSHITFGAIAQDIELRPHQLNAIAHILYGGNTLLAHEVGAGKTFEMVAAAMEAKRLGQCHKSLFAVPNHLTEQWAGEFLRLYPSANILVATKKDFEMRNRKKFCAKIATGDYDAVIIGHSQLEKIPLSKERQENLLRDQLDEIEEGIRELKASKGERFSIKQLEKTKKSLEVRLSKLLDAKKRDDVVTFEQLGCDRLYIDEAHNFKNLFLYTKMRNVAGLSTSEAAKSSDLFMKCRYLDELTDNKGVIFATGTPISNSMTEMFTMQRYLQHDRLNALGLLHFDSWASIFGETQTSIELAPDGVEC